MIKDAEKIKTALARRLLRWYDLEKRPLPWRESADPYRIWISEIMLQQTQVDTVMPYYRHFLDTFPTLEALAAAPLQDVLKVWENMGYYSRARNLHHAAKLMMENFGGQVPTVPEDMKKLPGIGPYTAGAIGSMAYGLAVPAVDGNVRRILCRLFAFPEPVDQPQVQRRLEQAAAVLVPLKRPGDFNQALMDLGATICKAKAPACSHCPINPCCRARALSLQDRLPVTREKPPVPHRDEAVAVIRNRGNLILMVQRPARGLLGSLWQFPGGFISEPHDLEHELGKIIHRDWNIQIRVGPLITAVNHAYTHFRITLYAYEAGLCGGTPRPVTGRLWRWVAWDELKALPLAKVDRMVMKAVLSKASRIMT